MIIGIGIDLVENERLLPWIAKPALLNKYFTEKELKDVFDGNQPEASLAARFAAKEAFGKALGSGLRGLNLNQIEVVREIDGKPVIHLSGKAEDIAKRQKVSKIHVSLSHEKGHSVAFVLLED